MARGVRPFPQALRAVSPLLNWGTVLLVGAVVYYVAISWSLACGILLFVGGARSFFKEAQFC